MGRLKTLTLSFALVLLVFTNFVTSADKCRTGCKGGGAHTFKYVEGTTYKYNLDGSIDISLSTGENQQSSTKIKANVLVTQLPQCNQLLRLQNVQVIGPDAKKYGSLSDIEKPIRFNFNDGRIDDSLCTLPNDNQNSLNIKRAVVSLFQSAIKENYETDVFGVCPTEIKTRKEGHNFIIQKSRNLNKCSHRETITQDFMATAFNFDSDVKSTPLLNGEYISEQRVKNGILEYASVTENYLHVPFSVGQHGAKATVSTKIQFTGSATESAQDSTNSPRSIIFENPHIITTDHSNVDVILNALKETKNTIDVTVGENSAKAFLNLFKILRASKKDDILTVFRQVKSGAGFKDKEGVRQVFLDAVFRAGTGECVEVGIELLKSKELGPLEQKLVYLSLAFVKHATLDSISAANSLLDQAEIPREAYLGIGTLTRRYCRQHACENIDAINNLVQKLITKLGSGKPKGRKEENEMISALKALTNMGELTDAAAAKVIAIVQDKKAPARLRVAALETYGANACKDKIRDSALNTLKDIQQDSEIRIRAYLVVAKCPTGKTANAIKGFLDHEPSLQVGGFIISHIRSLKASVNPDKDLAKHFLGKINTNKNFPFDFRKFSFHNEYSGAINSYGISGAVASNVIYSQESFLPVSADLNLTAEVYGATYNFIELGFRQENLGKLLEHYFGPLGVINSATPEELVNTGKSSVERLMKHFQQRLSKTRGKRDVTKAELDGIGKQVQIKTHDLNKDLDIDISVKMFGTERLFLSINDQTDNLSPDAIIDHIFDVLDDGIKKAKSFEKSVQSNCVFLDSEFSYPTSLGFPLRVNVEGTSSVQAKVVSKIDIRGLLSDGQGTSPLKISLIPSANIEVSGSLTVDAQVVESGLKFASTLYTATGADLEVVVADNGNKLDVKFSLPVQEQKLISASHEIVFNTRELGKPEHNQAIKFGQNKDFSICIDQLSPFIGVAFCADINSPPTHSTHGVVLPYPLAGNAKFSVGIQREDLSHFHFIRNMYNDPDKTGIEYLIETIGAKNDKKVSLQLEGFVYPSTSYVKANLISPIMPLTIEARTTYAHPEYSVSVQVDQGKQQYLAKIGFTVTKSGQKHIYKPLIQYNGPGLKGQKIPLNVEGAITVEPLPRGSKYVFDNVRIIGANQKTVNLEGSFGVDGYSYFSDISVSDGHNSGSLKGNVEIQKNKISVDGEMKNSFSPEANFNLKYILKIEDNFDSSFQFTHGRDLSSKNNQLKLDNLISFKRPKAKSYEFTTKNKLSYPATHVDVKCDIEAAPKKIKYDVYLHYGALKVGSELDLKLARKTKADYDFTFKIHGFDNKLEVVANREVMGDKSKIGNSIDFNGNKLQVDGMITHHLKHDDTNIGADLLIKIPGRPAAFKLEQGYILKPALLDAFLKISSGSIPYVDFVIKSNRAGNSNGNIKITLKDFVVGNGQLTAVKGVGTAFVIVDFVKFHRKFKVDSSFTIAEPKYDLILTFYPDFEKDNNNKLVISTQNQVKAKFIDSKNFIDVSGKKLEVNIKGSYEGSVGNGKQDVEVDVTLPTNHYFLIKLNRDYHIDKDIESGHGHLVIEKRDNKNAPGDKFEITGELKNTNREQGLYDVSYVINAVNAQGKNLNVQIATKRQPQADRYSVDGNLKISGSVIPDVFEINSNILYKGFVGTYNVESKYGQQNTLKINGAYDVDDDDKKIEGNFNVALKTVSSFVQSVQVSGSGAITLPENQDDKVKLIGNCVLLVDDSNTKNDPIIDWKLSGEAYVGSAAGNMKGSAQLQKLDPVNGELKYEISDNKLYGQVSADYKKGQSVKADLTIVKPSEHEYNIDFKLDSPQAPGTRLEIKSKESPDGKTINNEVTFTTDKKKFVLTNELVFSQIAPAFDIKLVYPNGKNDNFMAKLNKISAQHIAGVLKIGVSYNNFELDSDWDANLENIDNFVIKVNVHSAALTLEKVHMEVLNKPAKGGKRIQVTATSAGKNLLSGSTTYKAREEGDKYIVEGSGSFKVQEVNKQANFKFVRQRLLSVKNGEEGVEVSFNAAIGSQAIDAEFKATDKQFRVMNSYCEEKQQCAHIEIDSKTNIASAGEYNNELEVAIDLRKLGLSHEFGLKGVTIRKGFVLDHNVDIYFQEKANKYQYSVYVHPNEAGAQLTTPKRIIAIEGVIQIPKDMKKSIGPIKGELAFYLDKQNQPDQKTALSGLLTCQGNTQARACNGELKFTNPALGKDLSIKYTSDYDLGKVIYQQNIVIDVFASPNQQIIISGNSHGNRIGNTGIAVNAVYELKSQGMNINLKFEDDLYLDYDKYELKYTELLTTIVSNQKHSTGIVLSVDKQQSSLVVKICDKDLINAKSQLQINEDQVVADTNINIVGVSPLVSHLEMTKPATLKYTIGTKASPNNKLYIYASYVPNQIAEIKGEFHQGGAKINLANAYVKLDERNFFKSDSTVHSENIQKHILAPIKTDLSQFIREVEVVAKSASKDCTAEVQNVAEVLKNNVPNLKPLKDYYHRELEKLHDEVVSDKTLKEIEDFLKTVFGTFVHSAQEVFGHISEIIENIVITLQQQFAKTVEIINKELIPKFTEIAQGFMKVAANVFDQMTDLVFTYIAKIAAFMEEHQEEIKRFTATISAVVQDLGRALYKIGKHAQLVVSKEWNEFYEGIRKLPIAEELKLRYEQLLGGVEIPTALINTFKEAAITLKDAMPSQDLKKLVGLIGDYIEKKLKHESVDDIASFHNIVALLIEIIDKAFSTVDTSKDTSVLDKPLSLLPTDIISNWPKLGAVKLSPINYLRSERLPNWKDLLYAVSLNPHHWIPPYELDAVIVQGQHIFTFDGKHITFPGDCNYLFSRDAFNGNFSIAGTFAKGSLASITFADKNRMVTIKKGGAVLLNNAAAEIPIHAPKLDVLRLNNLMSINSKSGVIITCDVELVVCAIQVSGYYHGQLRGLLGNGNTEPFDDFTIPNGKIVTSESEFGNSYKLGSSCVAVKTVDHNVHQHNPICNALFGDDSTFRLCYPFVNPENYKIACDHGLAAGVKDTEKAIVAGYIVNCQIKLIPVNFPPQYLQCENGDKHYNVGDKFSVKTPAKAADIVIVVDQGKSNEVVYKEFVQPILTQLVTDLNAKGINDIEMHMITYGGEFQDQPSHHTVAGRITFKGRSPNLKFSEEVPKKPFDTGCVQTDNFLETIRSIHKEVQLLSGQTVQQKAYQEAIQYPFRAHAVKSIIGVIGKPCEQGLQKLRTLFFGNEEISLNLITPFESFTVGDPKQTKNVIGFNSQNVFAITDKKKLEGSSDHHEDLDYDDYCVDFALKSHGNAFVVNNFLQAKGAVRKQFVQVASHNIVEQMTNIEHGLDCECKVVSPFLAQNVCKVVHSKEKPNAAKKAGHKG